MTLDYVYHCAKELGIKVEPYVTQWEQIRYRFTVPTDNGRMQVGSAKTIREAAAFLGVYYLGMTYGKQRRVGA
jgi:hypothetical protein